MPKQVKITDQVAEDLEKWAGADGTSLAGEIKLLLDIRANKGAADEISSRLDKMGAYLEKKFAHLESLIEDTTVDRLDGNRGGGKNAQSTPQFQNKVYLKWEHAQPLLYEVMEEKDYASTYASNVCHEANEELELYVMDGCLYLPGWGGDTLVATISPKIRDYLSSKGYDIM